MKNISLKMGDDIFLETERTIAKTGANRNSYINEAVEFYNRLQKRKMLSKQLRKDSKLAREESMKVLEEFEAL